jgi:signal transduction histidine kinase
MPATFRTLSLTVKLLLIGFIPILFLGYFSIMIYREKSQKVELIGNYIEHVEQSANISELIAELSRERRYSYFYILKDSVYSQILPHRAKTDSIMRILNKSKDLALRNYTKYTFLDNLSVMRAAVDSSKINTDQVIQYYTDAIFRLNTLASEIPGNTFLKPVYQDLIAQRTLAQMITYFGIIRTNVFNVLFTRKYMLETLFGTLGVYKVYKTYETEFLLKASPGAVSKYDNVKKITDLKMSDAYLDSLFTTFKFDSTFDASRWWNVSTNSMIALRRQQRALWQSVDLRMKDIYQREKKSKNETLLFLLLAIALVTFFVSYILLHIHKLLNEIKRAAAKISKGGSGLQLRNMPNDIIGDLADCIIDIDKNNLTLAQTANRIGKGNFDVEVKPRSEEDLLGISIKKMKNDLQQYASQKDKIQKETEDLIYRRDEFFSIASHELKTPVTSLKAYTQLLLMDTKGEEDSQQKNMLERMDMQINKLTALINDLLDTSKIENGHLVYNKEKFLLKDLITEIIEDVTVTSLDHEIIFNPNSNAEIFGDRDRIGQVVSNFLTNAIKYASECKKIIVSLEDKNHKVICSVRDFGKGIIADEQDKIFERFYRISGHNLNTFPGLGLGLFICKEIIEKHDGKIGLESEKGKGSTFYFELPASE